MHIVLIALLAVQAVDCAVHVLSGQVDPTRLLASAALAAGALWSVRTPSHAWLVLSICNAGYAIANVVFVMDEGALSSETQSLRYALVVFVMSSLALSMTLRLKLSRG